MKFILILVSAFCISTNGLQLPEELIKHSNVAIAKWLSQAFLNRMKYGLYEKAGESRVGLLPPLPDQIVLNSMERPLDINIEGLFQSAGHLSLCAPKVTGLSKTTDNFEFSTIGGLYAEWTLEVPSTLTLEAPYQLLQLLNSSTLFPDGAINVEGEGPFVGSFDNFFFQLKVNATGIMDKLSLNDLWLDIDFEKLTAHAENMVIDGVAADVDNLATTIQSIFDAVWNDATKPVVNEMIRCTLDHAVRDCNALELINFIWWCLDFEPNPTCFGGLSEFEFFGQEEQSVNAIGFCDPTATTTVDPSAPTTTGSTGTTGSDATTTKPDDNSGAIIHSGTFVAAIVVIGRLFNHSL